MAEKIDTKCNILIIVLYSIPALSCPAIMKFTYRDICDDAGVVCDMCNVGSCVVCKVESETGDGSD